MAPKITESQSQLCMVAVCDYPSEIAEAVDAIVTAGYKVHSIHPYQPETRMRPMPGDPALPAASKFVVVGLH